MSAEIVVHHSHQAWFDLAWERAKLPKRTVDPSNSRRCFYGPTSDTPGCFIGVGLPVAVLETLDGITTNPAVGSLVAEGRISGFPNQVAANHLQRIHDCVEPDRWLEYLRKYAADYGLVVPE